VATRKLSEDEFRAMLSAPTQRVGMDVEPPFDFWPYFEEIPPEDFEGYDCSEGAVSYIWKVGDDRYEHVLVNSDDKDVFMVIVLDRTAAAVAGHHLLDLPLLYGLRET
jgi:hypothetical protein